MRVIKRDGEEVEFDKSKIIIAITKANDEVGKTNVRYAVDSDLINKIANRIYSRCRRRKRATSVEEIQDMIETELMKEKAYEVTKAYVRYRYKRELVRKSNTTDNQILSLIELNNEEIRQENSNKNPIIAPTQRDYMAGEVSKDLTKRLFLPRDIVEAHEQGIIHFHDSDYFAQKIHNCDLVNLEDMLQNGTVISGTRVEKPHSFSTACNIATQIIAQVASCQYGGQSITLSHLAPFVDISRQKIRSEVEYEIGISNGNPEKIDEIVEERLKKEITKGVQTLQYQIVTLMTTNGQAPFITVFMYLNEVNDPQTKNDLALIIEETLKQRYQGVKNESGAWITPAFPKLIYVLEEDNITENSRYWYLTELAAKCSAKRLVPDYISEKKMKELKEGNCFPSMGCVDGQEVISYKFNNKLYVESFERMWNRLADSFKIQHQYSEDNPNLYMDLNGVQIYDTEKGFVDTFRLVRNISNKWVDVHMSNGRRLLCTCDHPFETLNRGIVEAKNLTSNDSVRINSFQCTDESVFFNTDKAWFLGFMICDGCYQNGSLFASIAATEEDEIYNKFVDVVRKYYNLETIVKLQKRGSKGTYKDLIIHSDNTKTCASIRSYLTSMFGGVNKIHRHINCDVFTWQKESKLAFLAGMIDADGHINKDHGSVQIGSTNKELALQQMLLAQSLGMPAKLYYNHYSSRNNNLIRYRIEFLPSDELIKYIVCQKKIRNYKVGISGKHRNLAHIVEVIPVNKTDFSYDVTTSSEHFEVSGVYSHNCRSFLSPWKNEKGEYQFYARFNKGVVTINLPDVALSSCGDFDRFWKIFDERLELCHRALLCRYERLKGTPSDVAPILWQHGALARLKKGETIDSLLIGGYSSISLGYAGLCECVRYMTKLPYTNDDAAKFGIEVMEYMNKKCDDWNKEINLGFSIYGTPLESTTYKFAKCLQKRFGIIEGVTDKNYITNSYHIHVTEPIDAFSKLKFESQFQELSKGGAISYIEVPNMQNNIEAVLSVIKFIYDNIMYAELNTKSDYCQVCGFDGEIQIVEEDDKLIWECPNCKNRDESKLNVARRTCGLTIV